VSFAAKVIVVSLVIALAGPVWSPLEAKAVQPMAKTIKLGGGLLFTNGPLVDRVSAVPLLGGALKSGDSPARSATVSRSANLNYSVAGPVRGETGTLVTQLNAGSMPNYETFDPTLGWIYVSDYGSNQVTIINGTSIVGSLTVGTGPGPLVFDPHNGYIYVTNYGSNNVTVINGATKVATVAVSSGPIWDVYDPWNYCTYTGDAKSASVSVINGTTLVATLHVGTSPLGITLDPSTGELFVSNVLSNNVSVVNGTKVIASIAVGAGPYRSVYDPSHGYIYVANSQGGTVSVLRNHSVVKTVQVGSSPEDLVYDSRTQDVFAGDYNSANVSVISGTSLLGSIDVGANPGNLLFNPGNGDIYVANYGNGNLSVINATSLAATINVGSSPVGLAYDPQNGYIYAADWGANAVTVISTLLSISPAVMAPLGDPVATLDEGQSFWLNASIPQTGAGNLTGAITVSPAGSLACAGFPKSSEVVLNGTMASVRCISSLTAGKSPGPGICQLWINVSDKLNTTVWSLTNVTVYSDPSISGPTALDSNGTPESSGSVGSDLAFEVKLSNGTGNFPLVTWSGLSVANCTGLNTSSPRCSFPRPTNLTVRATTVDSNGVSAASNALAFQVLGPLTVNTPTPSRGSADVGQSVSFEGMPEGGSEVFTNYSWEGLPANCPGGAASVTCTFMTAGSFQVRFSVTDSAGHSATSPPLQFQVYADPSTTSPEASRTSVDVGQEVVFSTLGEGGAGNLRYTWNGLPADCGNQSTGTVDCTPTQSGEIEASVEVVDSDGFVSPWTDTTHVQVFSDPSVSPPHEEAGSVHVGASTLVSVSVSGGSGNLTFYWSPKECVGRGLQASCQFNLSGTYSISATVIDGNGYSASSPNITISVVPSSGSASTLLGLPPLMAYVLLSAALVVMIFVAIFLNKRRRPGG
jgi:YVTN family beta-propeller protein